MRKVASLEIYMAGDHPVIRFLAESDFTDADPFDQIKMMAASVQIMERLVSAVIDDNPEDAEALEELMNSLFLDEVNNLMN
jgi:signal recognition particle receptor subunit beta